MNKILLNLICCVISIAAFAQTSPTWNVVSGSPTNWTYSFAGDPVPATVNGGSNVYTASGTNEFISTPDIRSFLPKPTSGAAAFRVGSGTPKITLVGNGATDELIFQSSASTTIGKLGLMNVADMTAVTSISFKVKFASTTGEWFAAVGYHDGVNYSGGIFATTSNFSASSTNRDRAFTSLKWSDNAGTVKVELGSQETSTGALTLSAVQVGGVDLNFAVDTEYNLRLVCNNSAVDQHYSFNGFVYTVPKGMLHLWIDNNQASVNGSSNLPGSVLATASAETAVNSFMLQGRVSASGIAPGTLSLSGINMQSAPVATMPVSFASFSGKATTNGVILNWQTASESNNSHFDVLRFSDSNTTPVKIGEVAGRGNSSTLVNYSFTDNHPVAGVNYYQLKQVDKDGKSSLSQIVDVKAGLSSSSFVVYQSADKKSVASIRSEENIIAHLFLSDLNGRVLNKVESKLTKGDNLITLSEATLTPGVYLGTLSLNGIKVSRKFMVNP